VIRVRCERWFRGEPAVELFGDDSDGFSRVIEPVGFGIAGAYGNGRFSLNKAYLYVPRTRGCGDIS